MERAQAVSKSTAPTPPRVRPNGHYGLRRLQCVLVGPSLQKLDVDNAAERVWREQGLHKNSLYFPFHFSVDLKLL